MIVCLFCWNGNGCPAKPMLPKTTLRRTRDHAAAKPICRHPARPTPPPPPPSSTFTFIRIPKVKPRVILWLILLAIVTAIIAYVTRNSFINWLFSVVHALNALLRYRGSTLKFLEIVFITGSLTWLLEKMWPIVRGITRVGTSVAKLMKWTLVWIVRSLKGTSALVMFLMKWAYVSLVDTSASRNLLWLLPFVAIFLPVKAIKANLHILDACKSVFGLLEVGLVLGRRLWRLLKPILSSSWWGLDQCLWLLRKFSGQLWHGKFWWLKLLFTLIPTIVIRVFRCIHRTREQRDMDELYKAISTTNKRFDEQDAKLRNATVEQWDEVAHLNARLDVSVESYKHLAKAFYIP